MCLLGYNVNNYETNFKRQNVLYFGTNGVGRCYHVPACLWRYNVLVYIIYGEGRRRRGRRSMDRVRRELAREP